MERAVYPEDELMLQMDTFSSALVEKIDECSEKHALCKDCPVYEECFEFWLSVESPTNVKELDKAVRAFRAISGKIETIPTS
jgi:hypothetical protein